MKVPYAMYVAVSRWDGQQWQVRIEDSDGEHRDDITVACLDEVAERAIAHLSALFRVNPDPRYVAVEPQLPEQVEHALEFAEGQVAKASREVEAVIAGLGQVGMSSGDIAAVLAQRALTAAPRRHVLIPNSEIAACGLGRYAEVLAVVWVDGDTKLTCCRACVEGNLQPWQIHPDSFSAAIYDGPGRCDICGSDITEPRKDASE